MPSRINRYLYVALVIQAFLLCLFPSCAIRGKVHPMVEVATDHGTELAVSTTDGILSLGTRAKNGRALLLLFYGDIPYQESALIKPAGGGFYRLETDVRHRGVLISNQWPKRDETLVIMGMRAGKAWRSTTRIIDADGISGEVYSLPPGIKIDPTQAGAGIFRPERGGLLTLVGMVKGTITVDGITYLAAAGLEDFRRCMETHRRLMPKKKVLYRPDLSRPIIKE